MFNNNLSLLISSHEKTEKSKILADFIFSFIKAELLLEERAFKSSISTQGKCYFLIEDHTDRPCIDSGTLIDTVNKHCQNDRKLNSLINKYIYEIDPKVDEDVFTESFYDFIERDYYNGIFLFIDNRFKYELDNLILDVIENTDSLGRYIEEISNDKQVFNKNYKGITISLYDCRSIMMAFSNHAEIGHLVICKNKSYACYADGVKKIVTNIKSKEIKSLLFLSKDAPKDYREKIQTTEHGHYFFDDNFFYINSDLERKHDFIFKWVLTYFYPPSFYFSYSQKDNPHDALKYINYCIKRYFGFIGSIKKDKTVENAFMNLENYHNQLISGDIIFVVIGDGFLNSFYPMRELLDALKNKDMLEKLDDNNNFLGNISKVGILPIIINTDEIRDYLFSDSNKLYDIWMEISISDDKKINPNKEKSQEILKNIKTIHSILKNVYNDKDMQAHLNEKCRSLAWATRNSLKASKKGYTDLYKNYSQIDKFPSID